MKKIFLLFSLITISLFSACGKPEQTVSELTVELGEEIPTNADAYFDISKSQLEHLSIDLSNVDTTQCGTYEILFSFKNEVYTVNVEIKDTIAPTLKENYTFEVECGEPFILSDFSLEIIDESKSSFNFTDAEIESYKYQTEELDTQDEYFCIYTPDKYKFKIYLEDEYGNSSISTIEVIATDTTTPTINGLDSLEVDYGSSIDLLDGITAIDTVDGDITANITVTEIDTTTPGEQICTYTVSDSSGNITEAQRTITVKEKSKQNKSSSFARSTSLECTSITMTYCIYGVSNSEWTVTYPPTATTGEIMSTGNGWPVKGEDVMNVLSSVFLTFSNGVTTITLNMGEACNDNGEANEPFWWGYKIVAHQTMYIEGTAHYCYMYDDGRVIMHTDTTRIDYAYWPDQMVEWFGPYGYSETNWIYY